MVSGGKNERLRHKPRHSAAGSPKQGSKWLGAGEYTISGRDQLAARWWLIQAVAREVPRLLESLHDDAYPKFAALDVLTAQKREWRFSDLERWERSVKSQPSFCDFLLRWGAGFHITTKDVWILDGVVQVLASWCRVPAMRERPDHGGTDLLRAAFAPPCPEREFVPARHPFRPSLEGWDSVWISSEGYDAIARDQFERKLSAYKARIRKQAEATGYRKLAGRADEDHFTWLALYQFAGLTYRQIHERYPTRVGDRTAIQKGVARAAKLAGIIVRTGRV
jgi:hypothetical protein